MVGVVEVSKIVMKYREATWKGPKPSPQCEKSLQYNQIKKVKTLRFEKPPSEEGQLSGLHLERASRGS
jgi:hypothetical protein